jgi:hypothetical protein
MSLDSIQEDVLTKAIGMNVDITLTGRNLKLTGTIFSVLKESNLLVLICKDSNKNNNEDANLTSYTINTTQIKSISLTKNQNDIDASDIMKIDMHKILDNESRNLSKDILIKKAETEPNFEKGLNIYEALSKLYKCTYDGKKIVLDDVGSYIEAPFNLSNLHCDDEDNKQRLTRIISSALKVKRK